MLLLHFNAQILTEVPEVYYPAVQSGPSPEEWTGADFPSLTGATTSNGATSTTATATATTEENQRSSRKMVRSHAAVARGGTRESFLFNNQEDFPSLQGVPVSSSAKNAEARRSGLYEEFEALKGFLLLNIISLPIRPEQN